MRELHLDHDKRKSARIVGDTMEVPSPRRQLHI
ncbi:MAG: hypothetical protein ACLVB3_06085 [Clostridium sp.]